VDRSESATTVVYICWDCGRDFEVSECDGLTDSLEVSCPVCGSDLVAVDFAAVRRRRAGETSDRSIADSRSDGVPQTGAAS
jgi:DNA-directed RNA polymerase subunit RPC12/RpoP